MVVTADFEKTHNVVKQPRDRDVIGVVDYPTQCKGLCCRTTPRMTLKLQSTLIKGLASACPFKVLSKGVMVACQVPLGMEFFRPRVCLHFVDNFSGLHRIVVSTRGFNRSDHISCT